MAGQLESSQVALEQKIKELEKLNTQKTRLNKTMLGRESRIVELKKEMKQLNREGKKTIREDSPISESPDKTGKDGSSNIY